MCKSPITGMGGTGAQVFTCGHMFHNNLECGGHTACPICSGAKNKIQRQKPGSKRKISAFMARFRLRPLTRVEIGLKRHYGKDAPETSSGARAFILPNYLQNAKKIPDISVPDDIPEPMMVFMEI